MIIIIIIIILNYWLLHRIINPTSFNFEGFLFYFLSIKNIFLHKNDNLKEYK